MKFVIAAYKGKKFNHYVQGFESTRVYNTIEDAKKDCFKLNSVMAKLGMTYMVEEKLAK